MDDVDPVMVIRGVQVNNVVLTLGGVLELKEHIVLGVFLMLKDATTENMMEPTNHRHQHHHQQIRMFPQMDDVDPVTVIRGVQVHNAVQVMIGVVEVECQVMIGVCIEVEPSTGRTNGTVKIRECMMATLFSNEWL
jgi:hypothetical protein